MYSLPNAKINIGLRIVGRRPDGYHDLQTVFFPIPLADSLEIEEARRLRKPYEFILSGMALPDDGKDNLVVRVFLALKEEFDLPPTSIFLSKHIPAGAGLGGGSADAAATLRLLNRLWDLNYEPAVLEGIGAKLGADVPFLVRGGSAFAEGIGERLTFIEPLDLPEGTVLLIATPHDAVPTKDAYAGVPKSGPDRWERYKEQAQSRDAVLRPSALFNAFETSVFPKHPLVASMKAKMLELGASAALMSGSGASVFGIFADKATAEAAATALKPDSRYLALTKFWHN